MQNNVKGLREKLQKGLIRAKPKLCKVCSRVSFLKCMECDVIYCSSKCQIEDWEEHQCMHQSNNDNNHSDPPSNQNNQSSLPIKSANAKHSSVQGRLKAAVNKHPVKVTSESIDNQLRLVDEKIRKISSSQEAPAKLPSDDIATKFEEVVKIEDDLVEHQQNTSNEKCVADQALREMKSMQKEFNKETRESSLQSTVKTEENPKHLQPSPTNESVLDQAIHQMEIIQKEFNNLRSTVQPEENPTVKAVKDLQPSPTKESFVDQAIRQMEIIRKFKSHVVPGDKNKDSEGYSFALVTDVEQDVLNGTSVYWVMPYEFKEAYSSYKKTLNGTYEYDSIQNVDDIKDLKKLKPHLVIAKIEKEWCRAQILSILEPNIIGLVDIDSGKKAIFNLNLSQHEIKVALERELMMPAFAIKVELNTDCVVEIDDIIKFQLIHSEGFGVAQAEVKLNEVSVSSDEETQSLESENFRNERASHRIFADQLMSKDLQVGSNIKLMFCDGSRLKKGLLHVIESKKENWKFYDDLQAEIAAHVEENPPVGYTPFERELVLAKYEDGCFYRAVCLRTSSENVMVHFIEYGSYNTVNSLDVMPLPLKFLYSCCSHTVQVKLASNRPISDIDPDKTQDLLQEKNVFEALVELVGGPVYKYLVTLNDGLVVFKV